jgi:hypothetical protein
VTDVADTFYTHESRPIQVAAGEAGAPAGKVTIKYAMHDGKAEAGRPASWYVVAHVDEVADRPGVAYAYVDGPADSVKVVTIDGREVEVPKGKCVAAYVDRTGVEACTDIDSRWLFRGTIFPEGGKYVVWLLSGVYDPASGTFYYHDKREFAVEVAEAKGKLEVHAYCDAREVAADVEVSGVGTYTTPFTVELEPGSYDLTARYMGQVQSKRAVVRAGETTRVDFVFAIAPTVPWADVALACAVAGVAGGATYALSKNKAASALVGVGAGALMYFLLPMLRRPAATA